MATKINELKNYADEKQSREKKNYGYAEEQMADEKYYKVPKYPIWIECIKVWLLFGIGFFPILFAQYYQTKDPMTWFLAGLLIMPALSTLVRRVVRWIIPYFVLQIGMCAYAFLAKDLVVLSVSLIFLIVLSVYGITRSLSKEAERELDFATLYAAVGSMLIVYLLSVFLGVESYERYLLSYGLLYTLIFLFFDHHVTVMMSLKNMDKQGNFSTKRIIRFNTNVYLVYLGIASVFFMILYFTGFSRVLSWGGNMLMRLIRYLVGLISGEPEKYQASEIVEGDPDPAESEQMALPAGETSPFWDFMQHVMVIVFVLFILAAIVLIIIQIVKRFQGHTSYRETGYEEYKSFYSEYKPEKEKKQRLSIFDRSPENRIRRAYFKKVRREIDKSVLRSDTPVEVSEKLTDVKEIVDAYNEVRYSMKQPEDIKQ